MSTNSVLTEVQDSRGNKIKGHYLMRCPGCKQLHGIWTYEFSNPSNPNHPKWKFNGDMEKPTFSPSLLVRSNYDGDNPRRVCHSFIRDGQWQFLNDCTHELAGKTVSMVPIWEDE